MTSYLTCLIVVALCCSAHGSVIVCEGSYMYLSCPKGQVLYVHDALYGRLHDFDICPHSSTEPQDTSCVSLTSTAKVRELCNGKKVCHLHASNSIFGDTCYLTYKYLEVQYACF
ncbi:hypothetical protein DPMN_001476 [Dreissena polymorpha]|uniref:SUEL-type lectin domain-containing protein n=1 Tax=Dreissena polymorpha TaxID=45954 RepID=A0A9D4MLG0_DREPO|nr:hypothetical protein DPMN_001476 [Dreissena polymorpha]